MVGKQHAVSKMREGGEGGKTGSTIFQQKGVEHTGPSNRVREDRTGGLEELGRELPAAHVIGRRGKRLSQKKRGVKANPNRKGESSLIKKVHSKERKMEPYYYLFEAVLRKTAGGGKILEGRADTSMSIRRKEEKVRGSSFCDKRGESIDHAFA